MFFLKKIKTIVNQLISNFNLLPICFLLVLASLSAKVQVSAQQEIPTKGIFWKISGNGLEKPSYLLGTVHTSKGRDILDSIPSITLALDESEQFCMEIRIENDLQILKSRIRKPIDPPYLKPWPAPDTTYNDLLTVEQREKLLSLANGLAKELLNRNSRPLLIQSQLKLDLDSRCRDAKLYEGKDSLQVVEALNLGKYLVLDEFLCKMAEEKGKKIIGLETYEERQIILDSIKTFAPKVSYREEADFLIYYIENYEKLKLLEAQTIETIEQEYLKQNLTCKEKSASEFDLIQDLNFIQKRNELSIDRRNSLWMSRIPKLIDENSSFIAVGVNHLRGEKGLIIQLRNLGYTVERIEK